MKINRIVALILCLALICSVGCTDTISPDPNLDPDPDVGTVLPPGQDGLIVISTTPKDSAAGVTVDTEITFTFNQDIDLVDSNRIDVMFFGGGVNHSVSLRNDNTLVIVADLEANTEYVIVIGEDSVAASNNHDVKMESAFLFGFTTGGPVDSDDPAYLTVTSTTPANGSENVTFNNELFPKRLEIKVVFFQPINLDSQVTINGSTDMVWDYLVDDNIITIVAFLEYYTKYNIVIGKDSVYGVDKGITLKEPYEFSFTTGGLKDPDYLTVGSTNPADGETGVAVETGVSGIKVAFIQPIKLLDPGKIMINNGGAKVSVTLSDAKTLSIAAELDYDTLYEVVVGTGAVEWAQGKDVKLESAYKFSFTTGTFPESLITVVSTDPTNGAADVEVRMGSTKIAFNEAVNAFDIDKVKVSINGTDSEQFFSKYELDGNIVILISPYSFEYGTVYDVLIGAGAVYDRDNKNVKLQSDYKFTFATRNVMDMQPEINVTSYGTKARTNIIQDRGVYHPEEVLLIEASNLGYFGNDWVIEFHQQPNPGIFRQRALRVVVDDETKRIDIYLAREFGVFSGSNDTYKNSASKIASAINNSTNLFIAYASSDTRIRSPQKKAFKGGTDMILDVEWDKNISQSGDETYFSVMEKVTEEGVSNAGFVRHAAKSASTFGNITRIEFDNIKPTANTNTLNISPYAVNSNIFFNKEISRGFYIEDIEVFKGSTWIDVMHRVPADYIPVVLGLGQTGSGTLDTNAGAGGDYIVIAYRIGTDKSKAIADINVVEETSAPAGYVRIGVNLNRPKGRRRYLVYRIANDQDTEYVREIRGLFTGNMVLPQGWSWTANKFDLNKGAGGRDIFLVYKKE